MSLQIISAGSAGGCSPQGDNVPSSACSSCAPKMALTYEEEAILGRMRLVKNEARPIASQLRDIESRLPSENGYFLDILKNEHLHLSQQLSELREDFREWSRRLEDATERKLIYLGHREPGPDINILH